MTTSLEKVMRVWEDKEGVYLEVRQNPDLPDDSLEIHTNGVAENEAWFGKISLSLYSKEQVLALVEALTEMAKQLKS